MYTVQFFIDKFEAIPENKWNVNSYINIEGDKMCAYGHCGVRGMDESFRNYPEARALAAIGINHFGYDKFVDINDGGSSGYDQPTPKQRILAALYDIRKSQQPTYEDITKSLAVLPIEEKSDQPIKETKLSHHIDQMD